jgi:hypothetical protein
MATQYPLPKGMRFRPLHEIVKIADKDCICHLCHRKADYKFSWSQNTSFPFRYYCDIHARKAAKRHGIKMPGEK